MVIQLDRSYKIRFKTEEDGAGADFSILDGFYEVVRSYGWNELNGAGISLQETLLDHAGISDGTALRTLQAKWVNDAFFYCIGMDTDKQIWVPESIIKGYPDPRIGSYKKLMLTLDLGVFANADDFSTLGADIMNYLRSKYGIDRPDGMVSAYANQWMTVKDFEDTDLIRKSCQGLVYVNVQTIIPVGNNLATPYTLVFKNKPVGAVADDHVLYLGDPIVPNGDPVIGALSESIKLTYGSDFGDIPQGTSDFEDESTAMEWYFTAEDQLPNNTAIEEACDINFASQIVEKIHVRTNFTKAFYAWKDSNGKLAFTGNITPAVGDTVYSDKTLLNTSGTITATNGTIITASFTPENEDPVVTTYTYYTAANQVILKVGYRCRNVRTKFTSPYTQALKYAYENIKLRQKIDALESELTGSTSVPVNNDNY